MFHTSGGIINHGDTVIFALGCFKLLKTTMRCGAVTQTKYGAIRHNDLIKRLPYGSKLNCAHGYVHALSPTPELWTASLEHRTQIVYTPDVSLIVFTLDLHPGSRIIEAGTGSGSLSHAILRTIAPSGHLYTFDFHEQRCRIAETEFRDHKYGADLVTCHHRDVCSGGFGDDVPQVDAVFLDLPSPWKAIEFGLAKLVSGGKIAVFSPCVEQIQQTATTMRELGFADVRVLECIQQRYTVKKFRMSDVPLSRAAFVPYGEWNAKEAASFDKINDDDDDVCDETAATEGDANNVVAADGSLKDKNSNETPKDNSNKNEGDSNLVSCVFPLTPTAGHTGYLLFGTWFGLATSSDKGPIECATEKDSEPMTS